MDSETHFSICLLYTSPQQVQDEQITVLAVLLDGPIKLYRGVGQVQDNN